MANPQKENGFTPIANEIMDALAKTDLSSGESRILRVVLRKTYGWNKLDDQISLSVFSQMTGMTRPGVCKSIKSLVNRCILGSKHNDTREATKYWFIKDYTKWVDSKRKGTSKQKDTSSSKQTFHLLVNKRRPTKETIQKKKKESTDIAFIAEVKNKYTWINIDTELIKMDGWLLNNPNRKKTRRFIINWLNRIEKPLNMQEAIEHVL